MNFLVLKKGGSGSPGSPSGSVYEHVLNVLQICPQLYLVLAIHCSLDMQIVLIFCKRYGFLGRYLVASNVSMDLFQIENL